MFRRALALTGAAALTVVVIGSAASAVAPNRTTISITCDRNISHAVAVVTLFDVAGGAQAGDPTTVECGSDPGLGQRERIVVTTPFPAGYASIGGYDVTTGSLTATCSGDGSLTFKLGCTGPTGAGASVTVR
jgi:hypothetical protein